jgi:hypothetical protein
LNLYFDRKIKTSYCCSSPAAKILAATALYRTEKTLLGKTPHRKSRANGQQAASNGNTQPAVFSRQYLIGDL